MLVVNLDISDRKERVDTILYSTVHTRVAEEKLMREESRRTVARVVQRDAAGGRHEPVGVSVGVRARGGGACGAQTAAEDAQADDDEHEHEHQRRGQDRVQQPQETRACAGVCAHIATHTRALDATRRSHADAGRGRVNEATGPGAKRAKGRENTRYGHARGAVPEPPGSPVFG